MRYVKVFLLALFFFVSLVFFFQNQTALSQQMELSLNLFFLPAMKSIPLPFYFLVITAFACGAILTLIFLVWDKVSLTARLMQQKWQIGSLQRTLERDKRKVAAAEARDKAMAMIPRGAAPDKGTPAKEASATPAEDNIAPDPDKQN